MDNDMTFSGMMKEYDDALSQIVKIAFEEMKSGQYEDATKHFDQIYTSDPSFYMAFFFRAFCKSHTGKRGDVYPNAQTLTSAFALTCQKAAADKENFLGNMLVVLKYYMDAMELLRDNAVTESWKIGDMQRDALEEVANTYGDELKKDPSICALLADYFKIMEVHNILKYGALASIFEPEHEAVYKAEWAKVVRKNRIKLIALGVFLVALVVIIVIASV